MVTALQLCCCSLPASPLCWPDVRLVSGHQSPWLFPVSLALLLKMCLVGDVRSLQQGVVLLWQFSCLPSLLPFQLAFIRFLQFDHCHHPCLTCWPITWILVITGPLPLVLLTSFPLSGKWEYLSGLSTFCSKSLTNKQIPRIYMACVIVLP